jgi:predicted RNA-binding protein YlxR (DUF448 family)
LSGAREELAGGRSRGSGRSRLCALTRTVRPEADLIRFVAAPDGTVVADLKAKLPGRGVWVGLGRQAVAEAVRKNVFARGLKATVKPAPNLPDEVASRLREAALGRAGLARKAGAILAGFAKVEAAVGRDELSGLLIAADAAEDGRRKMEGAVRRRFGDTRLPVIDVFDATELGLALGLPNVIHAAVLHSPAGRSFMEAVFRLQRYEGVGDARVDGGTNDTADVPQGVMNERYDE